MKLVLSYCWFRAFHGRSGPGAANEWPPSPWRLFCALVSAARPRSVSDIPDCLRWLVAQAPPVILSPEIGEPIAEPKHSVPLNGLYISDPFREGNKSLKHLYKIRRDVRLPVFGSRDIHYVWSPGSTIPNGICEELDRLMAKVPYFGIAEDSGAGCARLLNSTPPRAGCTEWLPNAASGVSRASLDEAALVRLVEFHQTGKVHSRRFGEGAPPRVTYRKALGSGSVWASFRFESPDASLHPFDCRHACALAEGVRRALLAAARETGATVDFLHGHHAAGRQHIHVLPLPSIGEHSDASIRRVLLYGTPLAGEQDAADLALGALAYSRVPGYPGVLLVPESAADRVTRAYLAKSARWSTVPPIVLPPPELRGREGNIWHSRNESAAARTALGERLDERRLRMVARMFHAAGFDPVELSVTPYPCRRHIPPAKEFTVSSRRARYLNCTRLHVTVRFAKSVEGPVVLGQGRFFGLGLFAPARILQSPHHPENVIAAGAPGDSIGGQNSIPTL